MMSLGMPTLYQLRQELMPKMTTLSFPSINATTMYATRLCLSSAGRLSSGGLCAALALICLGVLDAKQAPAQQPGFSPVIIATGQYRQQIKSMPIEQRPYRPFHFYGNAVRRSYYRSAPTPLGAFSGRTYPNQFTPSSQPTVVPSPQSIVVPQTYSVGRPPMNYVAPPVYSSGYAW